MGLKITVGELGREGQGVTDRKSSLPSFPPEERLDRVPPLPYIEDMNINESVFPIGRCTGLSKREFAAIHLMVPDSGDPDIDEIIKKAIAAKTSKGAFKDPASGGEKK